MLHIIEVLTAAVQRQGTIRSLSPSADQRCEPPDDIQVEAERSRSPLTMSRAMVHADLAEMMRYFGAEPDQLPLYRNELIEAENVCAQCKHVGRCRRWRAGGRQGDAPRLFCANVDFFEELTPDPFWTVTAPGRWHGDAATSPLLRLLASSPSSTSDDLPDLRSIKLEAFIRAAVDIDSLIDQWSAAIETACGEHEATRLQERLDVAIGAAIENAGGMTADEFQRILQTALCDPELAQELCRLFERTSARH